MLEIKGKCATALCYANIIDYAAIEQIRRMCDYDFTSGSTIRIMPDVHAGTGCTIGTTMTVTDKITPNLVGVDIGCGMFTICLGKVELDYEKLDSVCHSVSSETTVWDGKQRRFDFHQLLCYRDLKDTSRIERSLGTLGGGNHFIEVDSSSDGTKYLVIHTGSRTLGKQTAEFYQSLAVELHKGKEVYFKEDELSTNKERGNRKEKAPQKSLKYEYESKKPALPEDLCWLYSRYLEDYLHDVKICQQFAVQNRELIAEIILQKCKLPAGESFHTIHNYINVEERILRKGAIAAHSGEKVLIPINMRDGSILAVGKGNPDWNFSAPHGAGRLMSRSDAKSSLSLDEYRRQMAGIYTTSVSQSTLTESPMAYKSLADIIDTISDTVNVVEVLKPVYNFKAS